MHARRYAAYRAESCATSGRSYGYTSCLPGTFSSLSSGALSRYPASMQISDDALDEFITLYQAEFGKDISREDALEMAIRLLNLYQLIMRPLPHERSDRATPLSEDHRDPGASFPNAE